MKPGERVTIETKFGSLEAEALSEEGMFQFADGDQLEVRESELVHIRRKLMLDEGTRVVTYERRHGNLEGSDAPMPSHGTVVKVDEQESLIAFDDGEVERFENESLLTEGTCPICEKSNQGEAKFCGGCGIDLGEQALLKYEAEGAPDAPSIISKKATMPRSPLKKGGGGGGAEADIPLHKKMGLPRL